MGILGKVKSLIGSGDESSRELRVRNERDLSGFPVIRVNYTDLYVRENLNYGQNILMWPAARQDNILEIFLQDEKVRNIYVANGGESNFFQSGLYDRHPEKLNLKTKDYISRQIPDLVAQNEVENIDFIYARDFAMTYRFSQKQTKINTPQRKSESLLEKCDSNFKEITASEAKAYNKIGARAVYLDLHDLRPLGERNQKLLEKIEAEYDSEDVKKVKFRQHHYAEIAEIFSRYFNKVAIIMSSSKNRRKDAIVAKKPIN